MIGIAQRFVYLDTFILHAILSPSVYMNIEFKCIKFSAETPSYYPYHHATLLSASTTVPDLGCLDTRDH